MTPKKKTTDRKRTTFPREVLYTNDFADEWDKLDRSGKHDMNLVKEAIALLVKNVPLPAEWRDHQLKGTKKDLRECHVKGDLLLVYQIRKKSYCEVLIFSDIGTHSEIFG
ncbi:MAG: type II toxin-antitoxin system YafQ family toxin [Synergistaceae bacterium]|nr:type II toxin-antitoxin system YafQ family toxin [Synergistaceae bacterium]MBQ4430294.1 type II toxin-antitoxin system YafQ family toxin [Synergistaceae bacterium]MBQ7170272.1 type II toxin-antitoxin system YafQ family toxin [Synergistaceae bacterium]